MELKVVRLPVVDQRSVDRVLKAARAAELTDIIVIGYDKNGEFWTGVNLSDGPQALWMLEIAKAQLLQPSSREKVSS